MIVGFNHNINYRGVGFHVQTEDSGVKNPQLVTVLYHGGTIISSQKTVYADILKVDNLNQVVEDLAKEQHKGMLRRLTKGEFDQRIIDFGIPISSVAPQPGPVAAEPVAAFAPPAAVTAAAAEQAEPEPQQATVAAAPEPPVETVVAEPVKIFEEPVVDKFRKPQSEPEQSLDALIYAYLSGADTL